LDALSVLGLLLLWQHHSGSRSRYFSALATPARSIQVMMIDYKMQSSSIKGITVEEIEKKIF